ncbi:protein FAM72A-like [Babylonia areolata]|uniref:protein FAM72A-like n=1 Tax=Babylonia areolata TaxID=304850 RepID=UPI003FD07A19
MPMYQSTRPFYVLDCANCNAQICRRGMKYMILPVGNNAEPFVFATDMPDLSAVGVVPIFLKSNNCSCTAQDVVCLFCGSVVGYHWSAPCHQCVALGNGQDCQLWMFLTKAVMANFRYNPHSGQVVMWNDIPQVENDSVNYLGEVECLR